MLLLLLLLFLSGRVLGETWMTARSSGVPLYQFCIVFDLKAPPLEASWQFRAGGLSLFAVNEFAS